VSLQVRKSDDRLAGVGFPDESQSDGENVITTRKQQKKVATVKKKVREGTG